MSWRIATRHVSSYRYEAPVLASYNEVRMTPVTSARQAVLETQIAVRPAAPLLAYVDYWATTVHAFDVHEAHEELTVTSTSVVETSPGGDPQSELSWDALRDGRIRDRFAEFLAPSGYAPFDDALADRIATQCAGASPAEAVGAVADFVRGALRYEPGTTQVTTSALEALRQGGGVCQDFAHLSLALLRQLGIPARYTSGYLHPREDAPLGEAVGGASHAWVEAWLGTWHPLDPTNGDPVGERHVTVARGRDYADVAPLRGVYHGGALADLEVTVELTRLA